MSINKKALKLIDKGLSSKTVSNLTESQIDILYSRIIREQNKGTTSISSKNPKASEIAKNLTSQGVNVTMTEKELEEGDDNTKNPWAICHSQVGPKKSRKWERCVREVKKQLKEGKNSLSLFLETQIEKIVERNIPPRITKGDLLRIIKESTKGNEPSLPKTKSDGSKKPGPSKRFEPKEQATAPAPSKPATKPTTKPDTTPKKKPFSPGKNPAPAVKPAPKAIKPEEAKNRVIDLIMNLIEK